MLTKEEAIEMLNEMADGIDSGSSEAIRHLAYRFQQDLDFSVSAKEVKELHSVTYSPISQCKLALKLNRGDFDKAVEWLRGKR